MGEGWSDYWAITMNNDGAVGEYVTNNPKGIRRAAYSVPAATVHDSYADICFRGCAVHADGEVWAATLWDLRTQLGAATTDLLVLNGMKFTPERPSFLDARDGILQADQNLNGGANFCTIRVVFARHGMAVSTLLLVMCRQAVSVVCSSGNEEAGALPAFFSIEMCASK
jgi:extracellular elastinolytic metalloproteinase